MEVPEGGRPLPIHWFNTFFFQKIFDSEPSSVKNVSTWRNKITSTETNAFELGQLIIPVNIGNGHWALAIAYVQDRKFQYLDSLRRDGKKYLNALRDWFKEEAAYWTEQGHEMTEFGDIDTWEVLGVPGALPQQVDSSSCGVFVCYYANYITAGMVPHFQVSHARTTLMRKRISLDLLNGAID
jgi:sentrin-specific protease 1